MTTTPLKYFYDNQRHLVCTPYTIDNLHQMARDLGISRNWFHKDHYDIPSRGADQALGHVATRVTPVDILNIVLCWPRVVNAHYLVEMRFGIDLRVLAAKPDYRNAQDEWRHYVLKTLRSVPALLQDYHDEDHIMWQFNRLLQCNCVHVMHGSRQ